ncbi:C45 family peptidase [Leptospira stimsonii]|uniref:Peptidase C45 hydrolase domain-containing protein n=1 Tax=Leptospira stimsonii TaxID=2202203 RepID=A0A8B3CPI9_9LEPT|nr:C45 family peptidase [Leptospira stimsonii]RHX85888.1 hypothetical protein DLM78_08280 [Leptospira stimsonii]
MTPSSDRTLQTMAEANCKLVAQYGKGTLYSFGQLSILSVQGNSYEMGLQHGRLLRESVRKGVVRYFGNLSETDTRLRSLPRWKRILVSIYLKLFVYSKIYRDVPKSYFDELKGIADGSGMSRVETIRASFLSEVGQLLGPAVIKRRAVAADLSTGGCTGIVVRKRATEDGILIHGKNTDYEGIGIWNRFPTVIFCKPDVGYSYVKVTSAGLLKGNLSMNEHGLTIAGHFIFSLKSRTSGTCFTILENEIMRKARNLEEAIAILRNGSRTGAFSFMISDSKSDRAVAIDCNSDRIGIRGDGEDVTVLTNICKSGFELENDDILLRFRMGRNPRARQYRAEELVDRWRADGINLARVAEILGDRFDPCTGAERAVGNVIAQISTVTSAMFRPQLRELWVAIGPAPVSTNAFIGLDLNPLFETGSAPKINGSISPRNDLSLPIGMGLRLYGYAAQMYLRGSKIRARLALEAAIRKDSNEPAYARILGSLFLKIGDLSNAKRWLLASLKLRQGINERMEVHLLLGIVADMEGNREQARQQYRKVFSNREVSSLEWDEINPFLISKAEKYYHTPFIRSNLTDFEVSFNFTSGLE